MIIRLRGCVYFCVLSVSPWSRYTPFHVACVSGNVACTKVLLAAGCDTAVRNDQGLTGWELAEQLMRSDVVALNVQQ